MQNELSQSRSFGRQDAPDSFAAVLNSWPSLADLAQDLGLPVSTVRAWHRRNSIPAGYWDPLVAHAKAHRVRNITLVRLKALAGAQLSARRGGHALTFAGAF